MMNVEMDRIMMMIKYMI